MNRVACLRRWSRHPILFLVGTHDSIRVAGRKILCGYFSVISLLKTFLSPLLEASVTKAQRRYQATPDAASTAGLATALSRAGRSSDAYLLINSGRRSFPRDVKIRKAFDIVRKRYAKALLAKTLEALRHDSKVESFIRAAGLLRTLGQWKRAISLLDKAGMAFPDHWGIEFAVGQIYLGRYKQSNQPADLNLCLESLRRARELNQDSYKVLFFLALTCTRTFLYEEALSAVESILETVPGDQKTLALRTHIERARAADARLRDQADEPAEEAVQPSKAQTASAAAEAAAQKLIEKVTGYIPETLGAFVLAADGSLLGGQARSNSCFNLDGCNDSVASMALSCRNDTDRIGIGTLQSCVLTGDSWQVVIRAVDDMSLVAFLEGTTTGSSIESLFDQLAVQTS